MHISKKVRQLVYEKFGGRCAYCGIELNGKFQVDHADPVRRLLKHVPRGFYHKVTGERSFLRQDDNTDYEYRDYKLKADGCANPENHVFDNYMPACRSCNINKGASTIEDWRSFIHRSIESLNKHNAQYRLVKKFGAIKETGIQVKFYFETL